LEGGEMSTPDPFHLLLGRALVDEKFRAKLLKTSTRKAALKDVGIANPTEVQLETLNKAIIAFKSLRGSFGEGVGAA
jgi:hypothetical protein